MWALQGMNGIAGRNDLPAILDIKTYLADAMLYKVDRSSMASSLEVRVPYLDNEVVDYALAMPLHLKSNERFRTKAPLKELLMRLAPHYDINKPKKGFNFPLQKWLRENWKELVLSTINKNDLEDAGVDAKPLMDIVTGFYASRNNYFTDVWYIFNLALWLKKYKSVERL
jgi:asparagine synthase (glutamine-hydrolysing)